MDNLKKRYNRLAELLRKEGFITEDYSLLRQFLIIDKISQADISVVITGASGTGKNLIAKYIHKHSLRSDNPFVTVDVSCLSPQLIESELFGHEKGSFTGAINTHMGAFERSNGGTLFLDEIGDLNLNLQKKLLSAIETKTIRKLGGEKEIKLDLRIITATNKNLKKMVQRKKFRRDLFFRLQEAAIHMPRLQQRPDDIPLLVDYFINLYNKKYKKQVASMSDATISYIKNYSWPGNVRELKNVIKSAIAVSARDTIWVEDILLYFAKRNEKKNPNLLSLDEIQKNHISVVLNQCGWNKSQTSKILGVSRPRLNRLIERYSIAAQ